MRLAASFGGARESEGARAHARMWPTVGSFANKESERAGVGGRVPSPLPAKGTRPQPVESAIVGFKVWPRLDRPARRRPSYCCCPGPGFDQARTSNARWLVWILTGRFGPCMRVQAASRGRTVAMGGSPAPAPAFFFAVALLAGVLGLDSDGRQGAIDRSSIDPRHAPPHECPLGPGIDSDRRRPPNTRTQPSQAFRPSV